MYHIMTWCQGLDVSAYLLLYGIFLYHVDEEDLSNMNIPQNDQIMIRKVRDFNKVSRLMFLFGLQAKTYLSLLYKRYIKHLIGTPASTNPQLDERNILQQMQECSLILNMRNLHLGDLTDSRSITAFNA